MKIFKILFMLIVIGLMCGLVSCRHDEVVIPAEEENPGGDETPTGDVVGMYLLNEGNMGSNKCSLDYYDFLTGTYNRNIYPSLNPTAVMELGDVGNDLQIYGSKLYAVINCSHKVEVMDAATGVRIGQIDIPNCRYIRFHRGQAYVSSYVGPVLVDPNAPRGAVYRVDTASLQITGHVDVGYQPEQMEMVGEYMYVANSGGYRAPNYDHTVSVISMTDFRKVDDIEVGPNLHRMLKDRFGRLWVQSRGNKKDIASCIYLMDKLPGRLFLQPVDTLQVPCSNMALRGDSLILIATTDYNGSNRPSYNVIDINTRQQLPGSFITDGTEAYIKMPYGLAVHPVSGDIYLTDAKNYVSSGTLYCFGADGRKKWSVRTGDIPASITFLRH